MAPMFSLAEPAPTTGVRILDKILIIMRLEPMTGVVYGVDYTVEPATTPWMVEQEMTISTQAAEMTSSSVAMAMIFYM